MKAPASGRLFFAMMLAMGSAAGASETADPVAAERQYRVAQRLGADRSPEAAAAFAKAIALAPNGPLADDALVDLACLSGSPDWPEDVVAFDGTRAEAVVVPLETVVTSHANGDRVLEARYRLALIRMAPIPGRDAARAHQDLLTLAAIPSRERWVVAARYALGVFDEQEGAKERAGGAFARIVVERPDSDVAPRARAGFGRTLLAQGQFGIAAGWFQEAIATGVSQGVRAEALRELALREVLREREPGQRWAEIASPLPAIATTKGAALLATTLDGRLLVFNRKSETVQTFDAKGVGSAPLPVAGVTALATDPYGRVFLATKDKVLRWEATGGTEVVSLARGTAPAAIAVDASGAVWIADKRGDRVERWLPGSSAPVVVRESKGAGVAALAIAGARVIAAEAKTGQLVILAGPGFDAGVATVTFRRPVALAVDAAGRISVLDEKAGTVTRLSPSGALIDTLPLAVAGVSRPVAIAPTPDGALRILDESTGAIAVAR
jgi:streptogramin lyase